VDEDFFQNSELFENYYYVTKGREKCSPEHSFGPMIRENYLLHIVIDGRGIFRNEESTFQLKKGQYFLIYPGVQTFYEADKDDPWEYVWFGIDGNKIEKLLSTIGITINTPVGIVKDFSNVKKNILKMTAKDPFSIESRIQLQGDLFNLFSNLSNYTQSMDSIEINKVSQKITYTERAIDIIKNNYNKNDFFLRDVSTELSLNQSYLTSVFKETTGKTLHQYLIDYRIQRSRHYLETTDLSITEVAEKVGYKNPLSFTRVFKTLMKTTPSNYKKAKKFNNLIISLYGLLFNSFIKRM